MTVLGDWIGGGSLLTDSCGEKTNCIENWWNRIFNDLEYCCRVWFTLTFKINGKKLLKGRNGLLGGQKRFLKGHNRIEKSENGLGKVVNELLKGENGLWISREWLVKGGNGLWKGWNAIWRGRNGLCRGWKGLQNKFTFFLNYFFRILSDLCFVVHLVCHFLFLEKKKVTKENSR